MRLMTFPLQRVFAHRQQTHGGDSLDQGPQRERLRERQPLDPVDRSFYRAGEFRRGARQFRDCCILKNEGEASRNQDPIDISKVSETIAKATCTALVKYLDLLVSNSFYKIGIRANLNAMFVAYSAGSNATKLPPIYMESLDNELVPVLHRNATSDCDENTIILELIFRILNK
jgi:MAD (mothers against decapentaplegic) interacting protein